jgi:hypothetical protein
MVFENAQQLGLRGYRHFADFIKQDGAAFGQFEAPRAALEGSREGPFFVAKDFAFNQRLRNCRAVDRDEGTLPARAELMNRASHQLFASATGSRDQH